MKEYLTELVHNESNPLSRRNLVREYLQAQILSALQRSGAMISLAFHGGTALRFLYSHDRFSEDLDFALEQAPDQYDLRRFLRAIRSELTPEGYDIDLKVNDRKTVHSALIRFPGLLYQLELSDQPTEMLAIKVEVDTLPPAGAKLERTLIRRYVLLQLQHHDKASLLAGKLHAIFHRSYTKGRDLFDLLWYLSNPSWPDPNLDMLNHALQQTKWDGPLLDEHNWRVIIHQQLQTVDWNTVLNDVQPFLEPRFDTRLLTKENLERVLYR